MNEAVGMQKACGKVRILKKLCAVKIGVHVKSTGRKGGGGSFHSCQSQRIMYMRITLSEREQIRLTHQFPVNNLHDKEMNGAYLE